MELDSRKKSRRERMMRSKIFDRQEVREIGRKEAGVERLSHLVDGNNKRCLPDRRKGMESPRDIENVKKKIHARTGKVL